ncbi:LamG domain-containing protein [Candidatus Poribacteria bacterium]|nr:LamG domain-containing protein [Candidatus Poribacteria bacterium]
MKTRILQIGVMVLFLTGILVATSQAKIDPEDFIGIWKFDEGGGNSVKDASGNDHEGELVSNPKWVEGKFGDALEFDGSNYIDLGNDPSLQFDGNVTILFWAKPENVGAGRQNIVCKSYGGEGCLTQEPAGIMSFYWGDCGGNCQPYVEVKRPPGGTIVSGEWIHIAEVRDVDDRQYRMYKDGEVVAEDTWAKCGGHPCGDSKASDLTLFIGNGYAGKFRGILDEVAIIGAVLTENEIQDIMSEGLDGAADVSASGKIATTWGRLKK